MDGATSYRVQPACVFRHLAERARHAIFTSEHNPGHRRGLPRGGSGCRRHAPWESSAHRAGPASIPRDHEGVAALQALAGLAVARHVRHQHAEVPRQRVDVARVVGNAGGARTTAVQHQHREAFAGLVQMDLPAAHFNRARFQRGQGEVGHGFSSDMPLRAMAAQARSGRALAAAGSSSGSRSLFAVAAQALDLAAHRTVTCSRSPRPAPVRPGALRGGDARAEAEVVALRARDQRGAQAHGDRRDEVTAARGLEQAHAARQFQAPAGFEQVIGIQQDAVALPGPTEPKG